MLAENKDEMREKILEAALKRFMHYGASKTTMNEIADDLRCSKASLYYYFSDKKALHNAVLMKIGETFFEEQEIEADKDISSEQIFTNIIAIKKQFVERYSRLELFKILNDKSEEIQQIIRSVHEREAKMLTKIIEKGVASGEFDVDDPVAIAQLYRDAMEGLRFAGMSCLPETIPDLDKEAFEKIVAQQKLLTEIFVRGIKKR
ncbi:TetR/AcrR family transcriptional regulator [Chitinophaga ginsengisoli]|uniref:TetR family transcriptional regulator n=1 Tax=Chitinophaga ginsengisoli TaxID=363837 RepID=A0A2P8GN56_9BACT|nr:TetR/AcrR family transcriptional regulator [Chitinophaga ginsengisoli]PSL35410.1 TetR family transcriptional regulator [Chitinophaga ginsengisoli]